MLVTEKGFDRVGAFRMFSMSKGLKFRLEMRFRKEIAAGYQVFENFAYHHWPTIASRDICSRERRAAKRE